MQSEELGSVTLPCGDPPAVINRRQQAFCLRYESSPSIEFNLRENACRNVQQSKLT